MNPELPRPQFTPEQMPAPHEQVNEFDRTPGSPERAGEATPEREQYMQQVDQGPAPPPPPMVAPVVPMPVPVQPVQQQAADDTNPPVAADDDLIEKEWVDKAKKIIAETKDDPYAREREVSRLQADYLRKRYGKELGIAE